MSHESIDINETMPMSHGPWNGLLVGQRNNVLTAMDTLALASAAALAGVLIGKLLTHEETVCSSGRRPRSRARRMALPARQARGSTSHAPPPWSPTLQNPQVFPERTL